MAARLRRFAPIATNFSRCQQRACYGALADKITGTLTEKISKISPTREKKVTMIPGDGIGPELMNTVKEVFKAAEVPVRFEEFWISEVQDRASPKEVDKMIKSAIKNKVAIKGILTTPSYYDVGELQSVNMTIRKKLDLYANVVHINTLPGISTRHKDIDFVVIREQTEGEYSALEHTTTPGVVESLKVITRQKSERIAKFAFEYAKKHKRKKVTAIHKANIMKLSDGMFLDSCENIAKNYSNIKLDTMIVDNTCMQLTSSPWQFDVMVMPNLYGNIIANLGAGLVGGAGVVPGEGHSPSCVVFETGARHPYAQAVGKNIANPTAMLLCGANMLDHIKLKSFGNRVRNALMKVLQDGKVKTEDLGGYATSTEFTTAVIENIGKQPVVKNVQ